MASTSKPSTPVESGCLGMSSSALAALACGAYETSRQLKWESSNNGITERLGGGGGGGGGTVWGIQWDRPETGNPDASSPAKSWPRGRRGPGPGAGSRLWGGRRPALKRGNGPRWEDPAVAKTRTGWLCGRWEGPQGGPSRLLPEYEQPFPGPGPGPAAAPPIVNFHPGARRQRVT